MRLIIFPICTLLSLNGCVVEEFYSTSSIGGGPAPVYGSSYAEGPRPNYGGYPQGGYYQDGGYSPRPYDRPPVYGQPSYSSGYGQPGGYQRPPVYSTIRILAARWESERRGADVTDTVQALVDSGQFSILAENGTFGVDPDKSQHKRLYVKYRTRNGVETGTANEGDRLRLRTN